MPIRAELKHLYGPQWRRKRKLALADRGHMPGSLACDCCGRPHRMLNWAHLSGDPRVNGPMGWYCPSCHARHDTRFRLAATRRTRARRCGQMWLTPELELSNVPHSAWPTLVMRAIEKRAQMTLFATAA